MRQYCLWSDYVELCVSGGGLSMNHGSVKVLYFLNM
jgi:hypothetical protein